METSSLTYVESYYNLLMAKKLSKSSVARSEREHGVFKINEVTANLTRKTDILEKDKQNVRRLGGEGIVSSPVEKDLGILVDSKGCE